MRGVYTNCQQLRKQMLLLSCAPTVQSPVSNAGGFFYGCVSNVGQGVVSNFLEIFGGGHDFTEGVCLLGCKNCPRFYKNTRSARGIVFMVRRVVAAYRVTWGYGGVKGIQIMQVRTPHRYHRLPPFIQ